MRKSTNKPVEDLREVAIHNISNLFAEIMIALNLDIKDPSLRETPKRVAKMLVLETCAAQFTNPPKLTTFPNDGNDQMVIVRDITITSLCEHHFQPFIGTCHIGYFPDKHILGLSKFNRSAQYFGAKPQVQERLTTEIAKYLTAGLKTEDVAIVMTAKHLCCSLRGVKDQNSDTVTSYIGGRFRDQAVRNEFLNLINLRK